MVGDGFAAGLVGFNVSDNSLRGDTFALLSPALDSDDVPVEAPEVAVSAAARPAPRPRAAKPREPARAVVAASFWMVLSVIMSITL